MTYTLSATFYGSAADDKERTISGIRLVCPAISRELPLNEMNFPIRVASFLAEYVLFFFQKGIIDEGFGEGLGVGAQSRIFALSARHIGLTGLGFSFAEKITAALGCARSPRQTQCSPQQYNTSFRSGSHNK
jgi:hypothetical protein